MSIKGFSYRMTCSTRGSGTKFLYQTLLVFPPGVGPTARPIKATRGQAADCGSGQYLRVRGKYTYASTSEDIYPEEYDISYNGYRYQATASHSGSVHQAWCYCTQGSQIYGGGYHYIFTVDWRNRGSGWEYRYKCTYKSIDYGGSERTIWDRGWSPWTWPKDYTPIENWPDNAVQEYIGNMFAVYDEFRMIPRRNDFAAAYVAAAQSLPEADVNLIGNIKEAVEYICGFVEAVKDPASAASSLVNTFTNPKDLWLQYRYVYNTNQMDAKELEDVVSRINFLSTIAGEDMKCTGSAKRDGITYGVSFRLPVSSCIPNDFLSLCDQFGLKVTPSNIWDLIPYSFMVDWFLGIGDKISFIENWYDAMKLDPKSIWFTARYSDNNGDIYMRIPGTKPNVPPVYSEHETQGKTVLMRIADTVAIFT